jgi:hypothetical protein
MLNNIKDDFFSFSLVPYLFKKKLRNQIYEFNVTKKSFKLAAHLYKLMKPLC